MLQAEINNKVFELEFSDSTYSTGKLDGNDFEIDFVDLPNDAFHLIRNHQSYQVRLVGLVPEENVVVLKVNGTKYSVKITSELDQLLQKFGMKRTVQKIAQIKSAMPGKVIKLMIEVGQEVEEGEALLVLEAMKMENVIKSPIKGKIKAVEVGLDQSVNKGEVLIRFE